jgi:hypothetical protein
MRRCYDNFKTDLEEIDYEYTNWIELNQDGIR